MSNHETPCKGCAPEFGRLAARLREAEMKGHREDDLRNQLELARSEIIRLTNLIAQLENINATPIEG